MLTHSKIEYIYSTLLSAIFLIDSFGSPLSLSKTIQAVSPCLLEIDEK